MNRTFQTGLKAGEYCNLVETNCDTKVVVNAYGIANVYVKSMSAVVIQ
jgi:hypothetical protein